MGSAGPRSPFAALKAGPAGAGAPSREEAKPLARPAGEAEDSGGCAALDGGAPAEATQAARRGGAQAARSGSRPKAEPLASRDLPDSAAKRGRCPLRQISPRSANDRTTVPATIR